MNDTTEFTDCNGNTWSLEITVGLVKRIRTRLNVDLGQLMQNGEKFSELIIGDPEKFVNIVWLICEEQAVAKSVKDEDFGYGFSGTVIEQATEAFVNAIADFYPRSKVAQAIRNGWAKMTQAMDEKAIRIVERQIDIALKKLDTESPE